MRYFLLLFCLLPLHLEAQKTYNAQKFIAELQKDTNVIYAFQMFRDIDDLEGLRQGMSLEQRRPTGEHRLPITLKSPPYRLYDQWQLTSLLKAQMPVKGNEEQQVAQRRQYNFWEAYLAEQMLDTNIIAYSNWELVERMSSAKMKEKCYAIDTVVTFHPETFAEMVEAVKYPHNPKDVAGFILYEIGYFNRKTAQFVFVPISIAPYFIIDDKEGVPIKQEILFWLPLYHHEQPFDYNKPQYSLAKNIEIYSPLSQKAECQNCSFKLNSKFFEVVKFNAELSACVQMLRDGWMLQKDRLRWINYDNALWSQEKINDWLTGKVYHSYYNDETKANEAEIYYKRPFEAKSIKQFRVTHTFAWDADKRQMHVHVDALAPMQEYYDDNGNFLSLIPLFSYQPHKLLRDAPKKPSK